MSKSYAKHKMTHYSNKVMIADFDHFYDEHCIVLLQLGVIEIFNGFVQSCVAYSHVLQLCPSAVLLSLKVLLLIY